MHDSATLTSLIVLLLVVILLINIPRHVITDWWWGMSRRQRAKASVSLWLFILTLAWVAGTIAKGEFR